MTTKKFATSVAIVTLSAASMLAGIAIAKGPPKTVQITDLSELTWSPLMKEAILPATAPIEGDAAKGAHFNYLKLGAGFESPPHSHTNDYWAVLVQGRMTHWAADGGSEKDAKIIGVGGLVHMPGKLVHVSKCYPGADCIMVSVQKGKNDFVPAPEAKK